MNYTVAYSHGLELEPKGVQGSFEESMGVNGLNTEFWTFHKSECQYLGKSVFVVGGRIQNFGHLGAFGSYKLLELK